MQLSKYLEKITQLFPDWTKIYKNPNDSGGGRFINAFASFLDNIENIVSDLMHVESLDTSEFEYEGLSLSKIDFISKASISSKVYKNISRISFYDGQEEKYIEEAYSHYQFFAAPTDQVFYFYSEEEEALYVSPYNKKLINEIYIDGDKVSVEPHHVWGPYDEIGLLIGCPRQPLEANRYYIYRLRDTYNQFANSSDAKLKNYFYRALIPFTSQLPEDVIQFVELTTDFVLSHLTDGQPDSTLQQYLEISNAINHNFDNSYWDTIEQNNLGLQMLPISWNLSYQDIDSKFIQNGVLRESDLELSTPELTKHLDSIEYRIHATKQSDAQITSYPETPISYTLINTEEDENGDEIENIVDEEVVFHGSAYEQVDLEFNIEAATSYKNIGTTVFKDVEWNEKSIGDIYVNTFPDKQENDQAYLFALVDQDTKEEGAVEEVVTTQGMFRLVEKINNVDKKLSIALNDPIDEDHFEFEINILPVKLQKPEIVHFNIQLIQVIQDSAIQVIGLQLSSLKNSCCYGLSLFGLNETTLAILDKEESLRHLGSLEDISSATYVDDKKKLIIFENDVSFNNLKIRINRCTSTISIYLNNVFVTCKQLGGYLEAFPYFDKGKKPRVKIDKVRMYFANQKNTATIEGIPPAMLVDSISFRKLPLTTMAISHTNDKAPLQKLESNIGADVSYQDKAQSFCEIIDGEQVHFKDPDSDTGKVIINLKKLSESNKNPIVQKLIIKKGEDYYTVSANELMSSSDKYNVCLQGEEPNQYITLSEYDFYVKHDTEAIFQEGEHRNTTYTKDDGIKLDLSYFNRQGDDGNGE